MITLIKKLGLLCGFALCLLAGCKAVYEDNSVHNKRSDKIAVTFEPTNATPKIKVPVEVQVEAQNPKPVTVLASVNVDGPTNVPVKVAVTVTNDAPSPLNVAVAVTNDASSPLIVPVTLRGDTNGIAITCTSPGKSGKEKCTDFGLEVVKIFLGVIIGGFVGGFIAFGFWRRQKQIEFTSALLEKYHSPEMFEARTKAWQHLSKYFEEIESEVRKKEDKKDYLVKMSNITNIPGLSDVSIILHYFERIAVMGRRGKNLWFWSFSKHCMVNQELARELLGYEFQYWNKYFFHLGNDELRDGKSCKSCEWEEHGKETTWKKLFVNIESAKGWLLPKKSANKTTQPIS